MIIKVKKFVEYDSQITLKLWRSKHNKLCFLIINILFIGNHPPPYISKTTV